MYFFSLVRVVGLIHCLGYVSLYCGVCAIGKSFVKSKKLNTSLASCVAVIEHQSLFKCCINVYLKQLSCCTISVPESCTQSMFFFVRMPTTATRQVGERYPQISMGTSGSSRRLAIAVQHEHQSDKRATEKLMSGTLGGIQIHISQGARGHQFSYELTKRTCAKCGGNCLPEMRLDFPTLDQLKSRILLTGVAKGNKAANELQYPKSGHVIT